MTDDQGKDGDGRRSDAQVVERLRAVVQDAHISFLVGAGTSSQLFAPLGQVEDALTAIDRLTEPGDARDIARASIQALFFDAVIWPNVGLVRVESEAQPLLLSYARFAQALNRLLLARRSSLLGKQISLFTTNVDLAFEVAFERLGMALNDGFAGRFQPVYDPGAFGTVRYRSSPRYGHRSEVPTFDLHKLHGSVGWRWGTLGEQRQDIVFDRDLADVHAVRLALDALSDGLVQVDDPGALQATEVISGASELKRHPALDSFLEAYERLVIVNPEKTKLATTVLTETYYELIRRFANELERETSVLFVHGFSFRDEHLRKIVVRAARTNPTLQVIVFCFTAADETQIRALITSLGVPNRNIEYVVPMAEDLRLDLDEVVTRFLLPLSQDLSGRVDEATRLFSGAENSNVP